MLTNEERNTIAGHVRALVKKFDKHPWDINCGECEDFSDALMALLGPGAESFWVKDLPGCTEEEGEDIAHAVTVYKGWYFDSEEPYGVQNWRHLPLCARAQRDREEERNADQKDVA